MTPLRTGSRAEELAACQAERDRLQRELADLEEILAGLEGPALCCPTCGARINYDAPDRPQARVRLIPPGRHYFCSCGARLLVTA